MVTTVDADKLEQFLNDTNYEPKLTCEVVNNFRYGFPLGYKGPKNVRLQSPNLPFHVGNETVLWNKIIQEMEKKRFAGLFVKIPFKYYIQSPVGLVPKDGGKDVHLIFHLSHPKNGTTSVNANTPKHLCKVHYPDFSEAVQICMQESLTRPVYLSRSDVKAAFRNFNMARKYWKLLVFKAKSPIDGKWYYFFNKAVPFGSGISCKHFKMCQIVLHT